MTAHVGRAARLSQRWGSVRLRTCALGHGAITLRRMIRSELVTRIAEQNPHLYTKDVEAMVSAILDRVAEALANGDRVELRGFGTFEARHRDARDGRNPKTGKAVSVEARASVRFRPAKAMHDRLNRREANPGRKAEQILRAS